MSSAREPARLRIQPRSWPWVQSAAPELWTAERHSAGLARWRGIEVDAEVGQMPEARGGDHPCILIELDPSLGHHGVSEPDLQRPAMWS